MRKEVTLSFQLSNYKDVDDTVMPLINQYYHYIEQNDLANANKLLEENAALLKPYRIDMNSINKIEQAVVELGDIAFSKQQLIISASEPTSEGIGIGSDWFQPY